MQNAQENDIFYTNWTNLDLSKPENLRLDFLSSYSFDDLLTEIYHNSEEISEKIILEQFEKELKIRIKTARETIKDNIKNILVQALKDKQDN